MDRELLAAALRVLTCTLYGGRLAVDDINLLKSKTQPEEQDCKPEELACRIIQRMAWQREPANLLR